MDNYKITGMSCAACVSRVEKAVNKVEGVNYCSVNLLTNTMAVEGKATSKDIVNAVEMAGYGAIPNNLSDSRKVIDYDNELIDKETPTLKKRLGVSMIFLAILMYVSMGHMMWGWPLPNALEKNHLGLALIQMLLTIIIMVINQKFFISGFKSLFRGSPNMDTLVALGSSAAFLYSTYGLFEMTEAQMLGDAITVHKYMMDLYFESAAMILTLITLGKLLEAKSKGRTTDALKSLMKLATKTATILKDNNEIVVPTEQVEIGDIFLVKPGENIPVDGVIIEGNTAIDEATLTGESVPVDKKPEDKVFAATINQSGYIKCRATRVGQDTTLSQIIKLVSDATATKAPIAKVADKVSGVFVPVVITLAVITTVIWIITGATFGYALARGISVLVISCPCALGLATPVAIMVGNGVGAKNGILFKNSTSLEQACKAKIIVLDKTGTITKGEPTVTDIIPVEGYTQRELLEVAYSLEIKSEHPLAKAVCERAKEHNLVLQNVTEFEVLPGNGLTANFEGTTWLGGNLKFIKSKISVKSEMENLVSSMAKQGKTPMLFSKGDDLLGMIAVSDVIKEDSKQAISELKNMGIKVLMLTGDNEYTANYIGSQVGADKVVAGVLPGGKEEIIRKLQNCGTVVMVGDGINDAPALARADVGIAIGAGTDVAIDAADIVLMKSRLLDVVAAIRLSKKTLKNIYENLFWAFIYNIIGIPLAAGVYVHWLGWELNPMFGAAAMSMSSVCVVTNALRLNLFNIRNANKDRRNKNDIDISLILKKQDEDVIEGGNKMTKTIKIEGMMCSHCEATVKKALEAFEQVTEAVVSHEEGTAVVTLNEAIEEDVLIKTIEDKDFTVIGIE